MRKKNLTEAEIVKKLEKAYACEDYFPGYLGNPVTYAARWGLPLSRSYRKFKERELQATKRRSRRSQAKLRVNGASNRSRRGLAK